MTYLGEMLKAKTKEWNGWHVGKAGTELPDIIKCVTILGTVSELKEVQSQRERIKKHAQILRDNIYIIIIIYII